MILHIFIRALNNSDRQKLVKDHPLLFALFQVFSNISNIATYFRNEKKICGDDIRGDK